jgi:hypothetical protein
MEQEHKPRTSMILLLEHVHAMDELTDEEFGQFIRAYADYVENGIEPVFPDRSMRMMWKTIKSFDEANRRKYSLTVEARREAGRKGAEKRWNQDGKAMDANSKNSLYKSDSVSDKKENIEKKNGDAIKRFKAPTIEQAKEYFTEKGYIESEAERFVDHFTANGWKVGKSPMKDWKAAARNWMRNVKDWNGGYQQTMAELPDEGDFLR